MDRVEIKRDSRPSVGCVVTGPQGEAYTVAYSGRYGGRLIDADGNECRALWIYYRGRA